MGQRLHLGESDRNERFVDGWSVVHFLTSVALALVLPAFWALLIVVLWEPLEVLVLSPLLARIGIKYGHESLRNTLSDLVFDSAGVLVGAYVVLPLWTPPFGWA